MFVERISAVAGVLAEHKEPQSALQLKDLPHMMNHFQASQGRCLHLDNLAKKKLRTQKSRFFSQERSRREPLQLYERSERILGRERNKGVTERNNQNAASVAQFPGGRSDEG